jgi:hypothetical protein
MHGHAPTVSVAEGIAFTPGSKFYEPALTFVAATAGLTDIFDSSKPNPLKGKTGVYSGSGTHHAHVDLEAAIDAIRAGALGANAAVENLCCMLAVTAWEASGFDASNPDPAVQVLRHMRNAAGHDNRWQFSTGQPKLPAKWDKFDLVPSMHGGHCFGGAVMPGDLLRLLSHLEPMT